MSEKILDYVKEKCGLEVESTAFDAELLQDINLALAIVFQLGGIAEQFTLTTANETWDDITWPEFMDKELVKSYVGMKVKHHLFDPESSKTIEEVSSKVIAETEYRIVLLTQLAT